MGWRFKNARPVKIQKITSTLSFRDINTGFSEQGKEMQ